MRRIAIVVAPALFVEAMLYAVLVPLLPHYVSDLRLSPTSAGLLTASFAVGNLAMGLPGGSLAARLGGRSTMLIGVVGLILASLGFAFAHQIVLLDAARFIQGGSGSILWSGGLTWASDAAPEARRGALIGTLLGVGIAGAPFGPLVGGLAVATSPTFVFIAIAVALLPLCVAVLLAPDPPRGATAAGPLSRALRSPHRARTVRGIVLALVPSIGFGLLFVLGPLRLAAAGASAGAIALTFTVASAGEATANPLSGRLTDQRGPRPVLLATLAASAATFALFSLSSAVLPIAVLTVVCLTCLGFAWVPLNIGLQRAVRSARAGEGHAFALFNMCWAGGQAIGALGGAVLAQGAGYAAPGLVAGALMAASAALVAWHPSARTEQRVEHSPSEPS